MRRETVCRSMYSDMSKRTSSMPMIRASWRVTSVLPTPGGAGEEERADRPFSLAQVPNAAILMAEARVSMALSWPKTTSFKSRTRVRSTSLSEVETVFEGIRAILDTTCSISATPDGLAAA